MKEEFIITSKKQYRETMAAIYELMNRGEAHLTKAELERVGLMTEVAEKYEDKTLDLTGHLLSSSANRKRLQESISQLSKNQTREVNFKNL